MELVDIKNIKWNKKSYKEFIKYLKIEVKNNLLHFNKSNKNSCIKIIILIQPI